jgi:PAS domain S-box-containing protein
VVSVLDITDRKKMERQVAESEARYRTIFQTTGSMMAILEEDMTVSLVNDRIEHYLGFSREEIEGKRKWVEFVPAEEKEKTLEYDRLLNIDPASAPRSFETRVIHKDGSTRDFFVTADLIPGTKSRVVSLIDITERKRAEMELRERERDLELRTRGLEEMNSALNVLLKKIESDKQDLIENIKINIHEMVSPPIEKLKRCQLGEMQKYYVKTLERNLQTITSPFVKSVKSKYPELSPKEMQIINFIKEGRTTKEIAATLSITIKAVEFHRYNIRKKFRLTRKKSTLAAHLSKI